MCICFILVFLNGTALLLGCTSFRWNRVNVLHSSLYGAMFWNSVQNCVKAQWYFSYSWAVQKSTTTNTKNNPNKTINQPTNQSQTTKTLYSSSAVACSQMATSLRCKLMCMFLRYKKTPQFLPYKHGYTSGWGHFCRYCTTHENLLHPRTTEDENY